MSKPPTTPSTCALLLLILASAILGGCGSGTTKTVTVAGASESAASATSPSTTQPNPAHTTPTKSTATSPGGGGGQSATGAPSATRTAPEPAFAQHGETSTGGGTEASGEAAAAAAAAVKTQGYTADDVSQYHPNQTLRVLLGTRTGSADGYDQRAFFFLDGKYLGTDSSQPSAAIGILAQSDTEVVLSYALYRPHDPLCCATGGQSAVHFQLNNGRLVPLQPIPPASSASGLSRQ